MKKESAIIIGNKQMHLDINNDAEQIQTIAHALSSKLRLDIIKQIAARSMNLNELAAALDVPLSTISLNIAVLEKAGLLNTETQSGVRGTMKLCSRMTDMATINLVYEQERDAVVHEMEIPIGGYASADEIAPTCGLAGTGGIIGVEDMPAAFYLPERLGAQLIWLAEGFLTYRLPTYPLQRVLLESLEISCEVCSEAINYRPEWPSDISMFINDIRIGSWLSPGDFGGRRGLQNPEWWSDVSTQYGHLITWRVTREGSFVENIRASDVTIDDLGFNDGHYFTLKLGVDPKAEHVGGMNLFGRGFGDYPQAIKIRYAYH